MRVRPVQYVPSNRLGRDFVVGDVHGCFRTLDRAVAALEFDASRDRLFGVGDLVERGPHSHEALDWIDHRFTAVTLGNHEDAALGWLEDRLQGSRDAPYGWLRSIAPSAYPRWRDALREMPLAVTVETPHGPVGIVHAESPHRSWLEATRLLERGRELDVVLLGLPLPAPRVRSYRTFTSNRSCLVDGHAGRTSRSRTTRAGSPITGSISGFCPILRMLDGGRQSGRPISRTEFVLSNKRQALIAC